MWCIHRRGRTDTGIPLRPGCLTHSYMNPSLSSRPLPVQAVLTSLVLFGLCRALRPPYGKFDSRGSRNPNIWRTRFQTIYLPWLLGLYTIIVGYLDTLGSMSFILTSLPTGTVKLGHMPHPRMISARHMDRPYKPF